MKDKALITLKNVSYQYRLKDQSVHVLKGVTWSFKPGVHTAIIGSSGTGKSTLLHLMALLDQPTLGDVLIEGCVASNLPEKARTQLRGQFIGLVYQFHYLLPELSALENVMMPAFLAGRSKKEAQERAEMLLTRVGLDHRFTHKPQALSGGEKQRVAIARALMNQPKVLLADEPTGSLDTKTAGQVLALLKEVSAETTLIIATHSQDVAALQDQILKLEDGVLRPAG